MSSNLFSFMIIYNRDYKIRIIFEYDLRIFHEEILVIAAIRDQEKLFHLKMTIDSHAMMTTQVPKKTLELNINI